MILLTPQERTKLELMDNLLSVLSEADMRALTEETKLFSKLRSEDSTTAYMVRQIIDAHNELEYKVTQLEQNMSVLEHKFQILENQCRGRRTDKDF